MYRLEGEIVGQDEAEIQSLWLFCDFATVKAEHQHRGISNLSMRMERGKLGWVSSAFQKNPRWIDSFGCCGSNQGLEPLKPP